MVDRFCPEEEQFICRIVEVALKRSKRSPGFMTYGRIADCINEAGRRLQAVGYHVKEAGEPGT